jgi:hypothetical protein
VLTTPIKYLNIGKFLKILEVFPKENYMNVPWVLLYVAQRQIPSVSFKERWLRGLECMIAKENKIDDINHMQH